MKRCHVEALLERYLDGELSPREVTAVASHLAACMACRDQYEVLRKSTREVQLGLHALPVATVAPDFDVRVINAVLARSRGTSLFDRLDAVFARPLYKLLGTTLLGAVTGLAALAVVLISTAAPPRPASLQPRPRDTGSPTANNVVRRHRDWHGFYAFGGWHMRLSAGDPDEDGVLEATDSNPRPSRPDAVPDTLPRSRKEGFLWHDGPFGSPSSQPSGSWC